MRRLRVKSRDFDYDVVAGRGAWSAFQSFPHRGYSSTFVLTERSLWKRWGTSFLKAGRLITPDEIFVPSGENSKSIRMAEQVAMTLLKKGADRKSLVVAFGGG